MAAGAGDHADDLLPQLLTQRLRLSVGDLTQILLLLLLYHWAFRPLSLLSAPRQEKANHSQPSQPTRMPSTAPATTWGKVCPMNSLSSLPNSSGSSSSRWWII